MSPPPDIKIIQLDAVAAEQLLKRIEHQVDQSDFQLIVGVFQSVPQLLEYLKDKDLTLKKFQRMFFGEKTEKTARVLPQEPQDTSSAPDERQKSAPEEKKKRPGHGRNGAKDYPGASTVNVPHPHLKPGDICPGCKQCKVYRLKDPALVLHIIAQPIFPATIYNLEQLRCGGCLQIFTTPTPPQAGEGKYDPSVGSQLAILDYDLGVPMNRIENLQHSFGVPLPAGTQWDLIKKTAQAVEPVFEEFQCQAAQANLFHTDDTYMQVLDIRQEINAQAFTDTQDSEKKRTGIFTTGMVARTDSHDIVLYFTGRQHAGENLSDLLSKRSKELPPPILMCDALSRNVPAELQVILSNCCSHGRRMFVDIALSFPQECRRMLEDFKQIYHFDAQARDQQLSPQARLAFHQAHSGPLLEALQLWIQSQFDDKLVEPNSRLGKAFKYMLKHWQALTLFLRKPGAPLDNNLCERILKRAIRHRKNSMFYKTLAGAHVGDVFMSIIQTCHSCLTNAFDYITTLVKNAERVKAQPALWMPWNFKTALQAANSS